MTRANICLGYNIIIILILLWLLPFFFLLLLRVLPFAPERTFSRRREDFIFVPVHRGQKRLLGRLHALDP